MTLKIGLSYKSSQLVKISGWCKESYAHNTLRSKKLMMMGTAMSNTKPSVFDCLRSPTSQQHPSMFCRMRKDKALMPSVFLTLKGDKQLKSSVFTNIKGDEKSLSSLSAQARSSAFNYLGETNEVHSFIPSLINCISTLDVKTNGSLKVKRRTLVITGLKANSNSNGKVKEKEQVSSNTSQVVRLMT